MSAELRNWSRTVAWRPARCHSPASEDEVAGLVRQAVTDGRRLKVVGAAHSFNDAAVTDGETISLDRVAGLVRVGEGAVTVRAGTRLRDLSRLLAERGLALPILGSIAGQSAAGAIATGTHGSSLGHGNLSSLILGARLVDGRGQIIELGPGDPRLDGVRVHVGALGVLTELTIRVEPAFALSQAIERIPVTQVAERGDAIARSAEYVKLWWVPHTEHALVFRYDRTANVSRRRAAVVHAERAAENFAVRRLLPPVFAWNRRRPASVPGWNRIVARGLVRGPRTGPSALMFATPDPIRHDETEAAVPLEHAGEAFARLVRVIDDSAVHVNFIAELRFVKGDTGWLSPAFGGDVAQLGAYTALPAHRDRYFRAFWDAMRPLGARPHWGKWFESVDIDALYPEAARFRPLRDEWDPDRIFANAFTERVFGH